MPCNLEDTNAKLNKSNKKYNMIESYLNQVLQIDNKNNFDNTLKNVDEYKKKIKKNSDTNYIYNENMLPNNDNTKNFIVEQKNEGVKIRDKINKNKNKNR